MWICFPWQKPIVAPDFWQMFDSFLWDLPPEATSQVRGWEMHTQGCADVTEGSSSNWSDLRELELNWRPLTRQILGPGADEKFVSYASRKVTTNFLGRFLQEFVTSWLLDLVTCIKAAAQNTQKRTNTNSPVDSCAMGHCSSRPSEDEGSDHPRYAPMWVVKAAHVLQIKGRFPSHETMKMKGWMMISVTFFPKAQRRVLVLHLGVWGLTRVRVTLLLAPVTVRNCLQPFATIRLRPLWAQSCRDDGNSCKNVTVLTCQKLWSCRFAWQAWHFVLFQHVSRRVKKSFCVAGAILLLHFQKMCCIIRGRRSTLDTSDVIFRCRRSTLELRVFCESHCQRCVKWKTLILTLRSVEVAVPMGKVAQTCLFRRVRRCAHVVLRGRRGALWHLMRVLCVCVWGARPSCGWSCCA